MVRGSPEVLIIVLGFPEVLVMVRGSPEVLIMALGFPEVLVMVQGCLALPPLVSFGRFLVTSCAFMLSKVRTETSSESLEH